MQWRLSKSGYGGWVIEYKEGLFSGWKTVSNSRSFQWEPHIPKTFPTKQEATEQMAKLMAKNS